MDPIISLGRSAILNPPLEPRQLNLMERLFFQSLDAVLKHVAPHMMIHKLELTHEPPPEEFPGTPPSMRLRIDVVPTKEAIEQRAALHRCWAELATEHERNYPLPEPLLAAMREAWSALGQPGRSEAHADER